MRVYPELTVDEEFTHLGDQGYTGTLNDRQYSFLSNFGLVGSLADMMYSWKTNPFAQYAVNNFSPNLVTDFANGRYSVDGTTVNTFSDIFTFSRTGEATYRNSSGVLTTASSGNPRIGHHVWNGSEWVNEGVLIEGEARTNVLTYSEDLSNAAWAKSAPVTIGTPISRKGVSLDQIVTDGTTGFSRVTQTLGSVPNGGYVTFSCFVEAGTSTLTAIRIDSGGNNCTDQIAWSGGVPTESSAARSGLTHIRTEIEDFADGLYRVSMTVQNNTGGPLTCAGNYYVYWGGAGPAVNTYAGGFQGELNETASSYIKTTSSSVTRNAESLTIPAANLPYSGVGMSMQVSGRMTYEDLNGYPHSFYRWRQDASNQINVTLATAGASTGKVYSQQFNGGVSAYVEIGGTQYSPGTLVSYNVATRHQASLLRLAKDGVLSGTGTTSNTLPNLSSTDMDIGYNLMGTIKMFRMWSTDIGDTGITEATT